MLEKEEGRACCFDWLARDEDEDEEEQVWLNSQFKIVNEVLSVVNYDDADDDR